MSQPGSGRLLVAAAVIIINMVSMAAGDIGTAISYDPPYAPTKCYGYQSDQFPSGNLFVAVSAGLWDNGAACGRRYRLKCLSGDNKPCKDGTIDVRVVDYSCNKRRCPAMWLPNDAFAAISKSPRAKINVEYVQI